MGLMVEIEDWTGEGEAELAEDFGMKWAVNIVW